MDNVFQLANVIAFVQLGRIDISVDCNNAVGRGVEGSETYERTTHKVTLNIPESAGANPQTAIDTDGIRFGKGGGHI